MAVRTYEIAIVEPKVSALIDHVANEREVSSSASSSNRFRKATTACSVIGTGGLPLDARRIRQRIAEVIARQRKFTAVDAGSGVCDV